MTGSHLNDWRPITAFGKPFRKASRDAIKGLQLYSLGSSARSFKPHFKFAPESNLMKVFLAECSDDNALFIHFSRELPRIPECAPADWNPYLGILNRSTCLGDTATTMCRLNVGCFGVELCDSRGVFLAFLSDLVFAEGLDAVLAASRYTITVRFSRCFDHHTVVRSVAECVLRHFYEREPLELANAGDPIQVSAVGKSDNPLHAAS
ncbi:MAG: hypothetical protein K8T91_27505 [Planctomycetes bacterium]|nr:hypothetical protein [Planctomycetota bacterium]